MISLRPLDCSHRLVLAFLLAASAAPGLPGAVGPQPAAAQAAAAPAPPSAPAPDEAILREALVQGITMGLPGISVAIGLGDSLAWVGTAGYADLEERLPVEPDDRFGVGSITKTMVARVVLQLAEEGLVALDRPATDYVDLEIVRRVPNADRATLRQLMNHQSGVPTWEFQEEWIRRGRGEAMQLGRVWGKTETLEYSTADILPGPHAPGVRYAYSNTNYTLLGLVVEAVTGNAAADEIRRRILEPLGMEETFLESFEPVPGGYVSHYHYATPRFREVAGVHPAFDEVRPYLVESSAANLSPEWTAGGMVASARDLVRWARALRDGELLGAEMQEEVFTWYPPDDGGRAGSRYLQGIAWSEDFFGERDALGHSGGTLGFTAFMYWLEETDVIVVLLTNVGGMHSGLSPSPPGLFFREVWLPAVMEWVEG